MSYKLFTDGGSRGNPGAAACAYVIFDANNKLIAFDSRFLGTYTNNYAEYHGLIFGLKTASKKGISALECYLDSELVVKQLNGEYKVKDETIKLLFNEIQSLNKDFDSITFTHIRRELNKHADKLVNIVLDARE